MFRTFCFDTNTTMIRNMYVVACYPFASLTSNHVRARLGNSLVSLLQGYYYSASQISGSSPWHQCFNAVMETWNS